MTMLPEKNHQTMLPFSSLLRHTFGLLEKYFWHFFVSAVLPLLLFYFIYWVLLAILVGSFHSTQSINDLIALISFHTSTSYIILFFITLLSLVSILGLITVPVAAVHHRTISVIDIFRKSLHYIGSYVLMIIIMGLLLIPVLLLGYFLLTIVLIILGSMHRDWIDIWYNNLAYWIPSGLITVASFFFMFAPFILVEKDQGAWHAVKNSILLVAHHFWGLAIRSVIVVLALGITTFVIFYIPVVGFALSVLINTLLLTAYNYILYQDIQH